MATKVASLYAEISGDSSKLQTELNKAKGAMTSAGSGVKGLQSGFQSLTGMSLSAAGAIGVAGIALQKTIEFSKQAITAASNLNETMSKTKVIFGAASDEIIQGSDDMASAFGLSQQAFLDASATFGIFGKSAGLVGDELTTFSGDLATLASDMASFSNTTTDEAIVALGAALRGETEPIRKYGVLLDDASLKAKALEMGIISTTKNALTPQQRVLAANALIWEQTADAQGDFERTSGGLANQQRILTAEFENLKSELGQGLIPVAIAATKGLVGIVKAINDSLKATKEAIQIEKEYKRAQDEGRISAEKSSEVYEMRGKASIRNSAAIARMKYELDILNGTFQLVDKGERDVIATTDIATESMKSLTGQDYALSAAMMAASKAADDQRLALEAGNMAMDILSGALGTLGDDYIKAAQMTLAFQLALGLVTQAEYDQQTAILDTLGPLQEMSKMVEDGTLDISYLRQAMADGKVTADELISAYIATGMSAEEARKKVLGLTEAINAMPERKQITIGVDYVQTGQAPPQSGAKLPPQDYHSGADFIVPPGYPNDSYPMRVESGERVTVIPKNQVTNNNTRNFTLNVHTNAISNSLIGDYNRMKAMAG